MQSIYVTARDSINGFWQRSYPEIAFLHDCRSWGAHFTTRATVGSFVSFPRAAGSRWVRSSNSRWPTRRRNGFVLLKFTAPTAIRLPFWQSWLRLIVFRLGGSTPTAGDRPGLAPGIHDKYDAGLHDRYWDHEVVMQA